MKIIFLGTNGWYTTPTGNTPCILIDSKTHYVVFDAGNGIYKLDKYIIENKPISLFLSHFHIDHISGLHTLAKFNFPQGIDIYFAKGRLNDFNTFANPPYTIGVKDQAENIGKLNTEVRLHELNEGENAIGFSANVYKMFHAHDNHGFRITLENKIIAYSGDTGICPNSYLLAKNADLLIHESSWIEALKDDKWGHVDPIQAAQLAKDTDVKMLALTHFDAAKYNTLEKRANAEEKAKKIFPNTIAAEDNLVITLS
jgi:ribonuclease BN (tRNA processing enzyme)